MASSEICQDISTGVCQGTKHKLWTETVTLNSQHPKELKDAINTASSWSSQWLCGLLGRMSGCYKARLMDPVRLVPGNENNHRFTKINLKSRAKAKSHLLSTSLSGSHSFEGVGQSESSLGGAKQWQKSTPPGNKTFEVVNISFMFHVQIFFKHLGCLVCGCYCQANLGAKHAAHVTTYNISNRPNWEPQTACYFLPEEMEQ